MRREKRYPERIIQFGEGNFLRCFVDWIVDILNEKTDFNSGVAVVRSLESKMPLLDVQDGLYTTIIRGINENNEKVEDIRLIQSVNREIPVYENVDEYLKLAENKEMKWIVSNTTEAGIVYDSNDKYDDRPQKSFPGKLTRLLHERYKLFNGCKESGFIILPCELIDYNGEKLKEIVLKYADLWNLEEKFKEWLKESNVWCSTLVDRIVSGYPHNEKEEIEKKLGYEDMFVTTGEYFYLFVIQGPKFLEKELKLDKVNMNIKIVDDIKPYKERKVGILNGAHTTMVPVSYLYGFDTVRESIEDDVIGKYLKEAVYEEIIPALNLNREELINYADSVVSRFKNPYIEHKLLSIALNSMSKFNSRVLPQIISYKEKYGEFPKRLVFSLAALIEFYKGKRGEEKIELSDDEEVLKIFENSWKEFEADKDYSKVVEKILVMKNIWGKDLNEVKGLKEKVSYYLEKIEKIGIKATISEVTA